MMSVLRMIIISHLHTLIYFRFELILRLYMEHLSLKKSSSLYTESPRPTAPGLLLGYYKSDQGEDKEGVEPKDSEFHCF